MIRVINLNSGNIPSIENWLTRNSLQFTVEDKDCDWGADDVILLPGVGNSVTFTNKLKQWNKLTTAVKNQNVKRVVAICGGFHSLCTTITEGDKSTSGLDLISARCIPLAQNRFNNGWSKVLFINQSENIRLNCRQEFYFNHGCGVFPQKHIYDYTMDSVENFAVGYFNNYLKLMQFHPEKSGDYGDELARAIFNV